MESYLHDIGKAVIVAPFLLIGVGVGWGFIKSVWESQSQVIPPGSQPYVEYTITNKPTLVFPLGFTIIMHHRRFVEEKIFSFISRVTE